MIDIFNQVYTLIKNECDSLNLNIELSNVFVNKPSKFPFVSVEEIDNSVYQETSDSCDIENHAQVEYELNIYDHTKTNATKILQAIDTALKGKGFVRVSKNNFQTNNDETIYLIIVRYEAIVSKNHVIYRR